MEKENAGGERGETEKQIQSRIVFDQAAISPGDRATARNRTAHDLDVSWGVRFLTMNEIVMRWSLYLKNRAQSRQPNTIDRLPGPPLDSVNTSSALAHVSWSGNSTGEDCFDT